MNKPGLALAALCMLTTFQANAQDGSSCANAIHLFSNMSYHTDTSTATNWMTSFGPLVSPSNDLVYTFVAGPQPLDPLTPTSSNYAFAMYLIPSCSEGGTEPVPVSATATVGSPLILSAAGEGGTYYVAITGTAAGGPSANGILDWTAIGFIPVELQSFEVD